MSNKKQSVPLWSSLYTNILVDTLSNKLPWLTLTRNANHGCLSWYSFPGWCELIIRFASSNLDAVWVNIYAPECWRRSCLLWGAKQAKIVASLENCGLPAKLVVVQNLKPVILTQSPGLVHHHFQCKMTDSSWTLSSRNNTAIKTETYLGNSITM